MGIATSAVSGELSNIVLIATFVGAIIGFTRFALFCLATYVTLRTLNSGEDEAMREHRLAVLRAVLSVLSAGSSDDGTAGR